MSKENRTIELMVKTVNVLEDGLWWDSKESGLTVLVRNGGRKRSYRLRFFWQGKLHDVGIGPAAKWGLKDARNRAAALKAMIRAGQQAPKLIHKRGTAAPQPANDAVAGAAIGGKLPPAIPGSFREDGEKFDFHKGKWSANTRAAFRSLMNNHVWPVIGDRQSASLTPADIVAVVQPHWDAGNKNTNSSRLMQYLPAILAHAIANDDAKRFRDGINVASGLKRRLRERHNRPVAHRKAIKWEDLPELTDQLLARPGDLRAMAVAFMLATRAPRSAEVRDMRWNEVVGDEWHVPAGIDGRVKNKSDQRVARIIPLSAEALRVLDLVRPEVVDPTALVFPYGDRMHGMVYVLRELGWDVHPHGMRTACKSWGIDNLAHPRDLVAIEMEQDRVIGSPSSEAYRDTSLLRHRRILADRFGCFLRRVKYVGPICVADPFGEGQ